MQLLASSFRIKHDLLPLTIIKTLTKVFRWLSDNVDQCRCSQSPRRSDGCVRDKVHSKDMNGSEALHRLQSSSSLQKSSSSASTPRKSLQQVRKDTLSQRGNKWYFYVADTYEEMNVLVVTGWIWVVKVTVRVDFAESTQAQPAEVLFAGSAGHLVAAIHFLTGDTHEAEERNHHSSVGFTRFSSAGHQELLLISGGHCARNGGHPVTNRYNYQENQNKPNSHIFISINYRLNDVLIMPTKSTN